MTSQGHPYAQFRRAVERGNFLVAWSLAADLPRLSLGDALSLVLLARDSGDNRRFERAAARWHALLSFETRLSVTESQLALASLAALQGPATQTAVQALASLLEERDLRDEVAVLERWLEMQRHL